MTCLKNICVVLMLVSLASGELSCNPNEVIDDCPANCAPDDCPKHEDHDATTCIIPKICPLPACVCAFNYRRDDNETCIPTKECPPFTCSRPNEEYNPCPPRCPSDHCWDASEECPFLDIYDVECNPTCRCIKDHWRKDGACVPYSECPMER